MRYSPIDKAWNPDDRPFEPGAWAHARVVMVLAVQMLVLYVCTQLIQP